MPKAKRKRLTSRKDYNRVLLNAKEAKNAARASAKCTASDNAEVSEGSNISQHLSPVIQKQPLLPLSPLIQTVKRSIQDGRNIERRMINKIRKDIQDIPQCILPPYETPAGTFSASQCEEPHNVFSQATLLSPAKKRVVKCLLQRGRLMRGRPLNRQMQNAIWCAYHFCKMEKTLGKPVIDLKEAVRRTAAILKLSVQTVTKCLRVVKAGEPLLTPNKTRKRACQTNVDSFDMVAIENLIYEFHRKS